MYYIQLYHRRGKSGAERKRPTTKLSALISWGLQREGTSGCRKKSTQVQGTHFAVTTEWERVRMRQESAQEKGTDFLEAAEENTSQDIGKK